MRAKPHNVLISKSSEPIISNWKPKYMKSAKTQNNWCEHSRLILLSLFIGLLFRLSSHSLQLLIVIKKPYFLTGERTRLLILWHKRRKNRSWKPWVCRKGTGSNVPRDTSTPLVNAVVLWREAGVMNAGLWLVERIMHLKREMNWHLRWTEQDTQPGLNRQTYRIII